MLKLKIFVSWNVMILKNMNMQYICFYFKLFKFLIVIISLKILCFYKNGKNFKICKSVTLNVNAQKIQEKSFNLCMVWKYIKIMKFLATFWTQPLRQGLKMMSGGPQSKKVWEPLGIDDKLWNFKLYIPSFSIIKGLKTITVFTIFNTSFLHDSQTLYTIIKPLLHA